MRNILIALLLMLPCTALANEYRCDVNGGVMYQPNRVISLSQEQGKLYTTVIGNPADPQYRRLVNWFDQSPELNDLKRKTHFASMSSDSLMFKSRYATTVDQLPCVRVQRANGEVLCQISGPNIPLSAEAMFNCIDTTLRRRNAQPQPSPYNYHWHYTMPDEKPDEKPDQKQPDVFNKEDSMAFVIPTWAYFCMGIAAMLAAVAVHFVKEFKNRA